MKHSKTNTSANAASQAVGATKISGKKRAKREPKWEMSASDALKVNYVVDPV